MEWREGVPRNVGALRIRLRRCCPHRSFLRLLHRPHCRLSSGRVLPWLHIFERTLTGCVSNSHVCITTVTDL